MKKISLSICVVFIAATSFCQTVADLDAKNGYKSIQFGMTATEMKKAVKVTEGKTIGVTTTYSVKEKTYLHFAGNKIDYISVYELKSKGVIAGIGLISLDHSQSKYNDLIRFFTALYGQSTSHSAYTSEWRGNKVCLKVIRNIASSGIIIYIEHIALSKLLNEENDDYLRRKGKDF